MDNFQIKKCIEIELCDTYSDSLAYFIIFENREKPQEQNLNEIKNFKIMKI